MIFYFIPTRLEKLRNMTNPKFGKDVEHGKLCALLIGVYTDTTLETV